jgi:hypothetical protein
MKFIDPKSPEKLSIFWLDMNKEPLMPQMATPGLPEKWGFVWQLLAQVPQT